MSGLLDIPSTRMLPKQGLSLAWTYLASTALSNGPMSYDFDQEPEENTGYCEVCGEELAIDEENICDACKKNFDI